MTRARAGSFLFACAFAFACSGDGEPDPDLDGTDDGYTPPRAQREPVVAGRAFTAVEFTPEPTGSPFEAPPPIWPTAASEAIALGMAGPGAVAEPADGARLVGGLPVRIDSVARDAADAAAAASLQVNVSTLDRAVATAAGVDGVLVRVSRVDGNKGTARARLALGYRAFRWAYGGDWASRLALWRVPECALSTPGAPGCRATRLASTNDLARETVSAVVDLVEPAALPPGETSAAGPQGELVMLAADDAGAGGDYKATSLSPSATWSAGGNAGDFSWSYPMRAPPAVGGPVPAITLSYSSSSVDGRMASSNNQASWIGEGFSWQAGSVERRYSSCSDDMGAGANNTEKTGDQCWETDNASMSFSGHAGELLKDASTPNLWHLRGEDGTRVERRTGAPNGDDNGEWWVATTPDGTQYWFGGRAGSNATLTVPVFGNHTGEPCHQAAFNNSSCVQGYRWMLDYVVDPHGNTMSFTYVRETNKYARNNRLDDDTVYDRDGYLQKIEYGTRLGDSGNAAMQVVFEVADRCLSGCTVKDAQRWPDVPWDRECTAASCAATQTSPSFWTTKRLSSVKTQVRSGSGYRDVESWTLTHSFPVSDQPTLWLDKITHRGLAGTAASIPDITFVGVILPNRVDTDNDQYPAMNRYRMKTINSETGGKLDITYSAQDCVRGSRVPDQNALHANTLRCYPVKWTPSGRTSPINDFFHKYLVSDVVEADLSGSSSRVLTHYDYLGAPAWHYSDDDGFIKQDMKTWSVWRGYGAVRTVKGDPGEQISEERRYFRGMHGDKLPSGTRTVSLPAIAVGNVPAINDEDAWSGEVRETITFNGPGGAELSATVNELWQSAPTASRTINGTTVHARHVNTAAVHTRTALDGGRGYRTMASTTLFDAFGMAIQVEDRGDETVTGDERCTLTDYVRNSGAWITSTPSRVRDYAVPCSRALGGGLTEDDVVTETRTSYDGGAWGVAPTRGSVTRTETLQAYDSGSASFRTESLQTYDSHGRLIESTDARGNKTITRYQPATGGPLTGTTLTTQLGWMTSTTFDPAWGVPLSTTDSNGRTTELDYDAWGRITAVWLPGRDRTKSPNISHAYLIRNNAPSVVTTRTLNASGEYSTSYNFLDNLLRQRQTQRPDAAGGPGAVVTDTYYDSVGRVAKRHESYLAVNASLQPVPPSTTLFLPTQNIPRLKVKQYDGAGREIASIEKVDGPPASAGGTELWRLTTGYGGDRIDATPPRGGTTPPRGGTATSSIQDARGNVIELRQYRPGQAAGSASGFDRTLYTYNQKARLVRITDPAGNTVQYFYDLHGNRTKEIDPDHGTITTTYTVDDDVATVTDARGVSIAYTYDSLGRKTTLRDGSVTGAKRAEWVYDVLANGTRLNNRLVKSIRFEGTAQYSKEVLGFTIGYKPTSIRYTIPDSGAGAEVDGTYDYVYTYREDGSPATSRLPALGDPGLGLETLTFGYNSLGRPSSLSTTLGGTLVAAPDGSTPATEYTSFAELAVIHLRHNGGPRADIARTYDVRTRRLAQIWTTRATAPSTVADVRFEYDETGNVIRMSDITTSDHQCFNSDHLQRLTRAWTPTGADCLAAPTTATLGGPAPYWHDYTYDAVGNRTRLQEHATSAGLRDTTYTVPAGAHRLTGTTTTDTTGVKTRAYSYDAAGNMLTRPGPGDGTQTMTWDAEGRLATSQDATGTTSYLYDADGARLLRVDPAGTTLYLPSQEVRYTNADRAKKVTRYYDHANQQIATRTAANGVMWLSGDHHDSARITIAAVGQTVTLRRQTPFGELRGPAGAWPAAMDKGFVGGTRDNTGLTHLGAREYDPAIGRFISVDPVLDTQDPQQLHGYAYANNAPITRSDASGLWWPLDKALEARQWGIDNAEAISTVAGFAAVGAMFIPVVGPALSAGLTIVSVVYGAVDTYKDCQRSSSLDCTLGVIGLAVSVAPGGKAVWKGASAFLTYQKFEGIKNAAIPLWKKAASFNASAAVRGMAQSHPFREIAIVADKMMTKAKAVLDDALDAPWRFFHQDLLTRESVMPWVMANMYSNLFLAEGGIWLGISAVTGFASRDEAVAAVWQKADQTWQKVKDAVRPQVSSVAQFRSTAPVAQKVYVAQPWPTLAGTIHSPSYHHRHGTGAPDF